MKKRALKKINNKQSGLKGNKREIKKVFVDLCLYGVSVHHTSNNGKIRRIDPMSEEGINLRDKSI